MCQACQKRRERLLAAARARSLRGVMSEAVKGAAEMAGLKAKTAEMEGEYRSRARTGRRAFRLPRGDK